MSFSGEYQFQYDYKKVNKAMVFKIIAIFNNSIEEFGKSVLCLYHRQSYIIFDIFFV
jgi:hypothetical protein